MYLDRKLLILLKQGVFHQTNKNPEPNPSFKKYSRLQGRYRKNRISPS